MKLKNASKLCRIPSHNLSEKLPHVGSWGAWYARRISDVQAEAEDIFTAPEALSIVAGFYVILYWLVLYGIMLRYIIHYVTWKIPSVCRRRGLLGAARRRN